MSVYHEDQPSLLILQLACSGISELGPSNWCYSSSSSSSSSCLNNNYDPDVFIIQTPALQVELARPEFFLARNLRVPSFIERIWAKIAEYGGLSAVPTEFWLKLLLKEREACVLKSPQHLKQPSIIFDSCMNVYSLSLLLEVCKKKLDVKLSAPERKALKRTLDIIDEKFGEGDLFVSSTFFKLMKVVERFGQFDPENKEQKRQLFNLLVYHLSIIQHSEVLEEDQRKKYYHYLLDHFLQEYMELDVDWVPPAEHPYNEVQNVLLAIETQSRDIHALLEKYKKEEEKAKLDANLVYLLHDFDLIMPPNNENENQNKNAHENQNEQQQIENQNGIQIENQRQDQEEKELQNEDLNANKIQKPKSLMSVAMYNLAKKIQLRLANFEGLRGLSWENQVMMSDDLYRAKQLLVDQYSKKNKENKQNKEDEEKYRLELNWMAPRYNEIMLPKDLQTGVSRINLTSSSNPTTSISADIIKQHGDRRSLNEHLEINQDKTFKNNINIETAERASKRGLYGVKALQAEDGDGVKATVFIPPGAELCTGPLKSRTSQMSATRLQRVKYTKMEELKDDKEQLLHPYGTFSVIKEEGDVFELYCPCCFSSDNVSFCRNVLATHITAECKHKACIDCFKKQEDEAHESTESAFAPFPSSSSSISSSSSSSSFSSSFLSSAKNWMKKVANKLQDKKVGSKCPVCFKTYCHLFELKLTTQQLNAYSLPHAYSFVSPQRIVQYPLGQTTPLEVVDQDKSRCGTGWHFCETDKELERYFEFLPKYLLVPEGAANAPVLPSPVLPSPVLPSAVIPLPVSVHEEQKEKGQEEQMSLEGINSNEEGKNNAESESSIASFHSFESSSIKEDASTERRKMGGLDSSNFMSSPGFLLPFANPGNSIAANLDEQKQSDL